MNDEHPYGYNKDWVEYRYKQGTTRGLVIDNKLYYLKDGKIVDCDGKEVKDD